MSIFNFPNPVPTMYKATPPDELAILIIPIWMSDVPEDVQLHDR